MDASEMNSLQRELCEYRSYVMRLVRAMGVDENDAEDMAEDIFVDACRGLSGLRDPGKMRPWLRTIAGNRANKYFARRARDRMVLEKVKDEAMQAGSAEAEEYEVAEWLYVHGDERRALVDALLRELPASGRQIVKMRFWYGYKHSEIAELMHMNINTEKSIYRRSLKRLRDAYFRMIDSEDGSDGK